MVQKWENLVRIRLTEVQNTVPETFLGLYKKVGANQYQRVQTLELEASIIFVQKSLLTWWQIIHKNEDNASLN